MKRLSRQLAPLVAGALLLGACADHPHGVLMPVLADAPGTSSVNVLVATTRARDVSPGVMFNGLRADAMAFADIQVSIPPDAVRKVGDVQWPKQLPGDPAVDFVTRHTAIIDRKAALALVHDELRHSPKKQVLVFVHGFNNKFEDAVYRFAQIVHDSGTEAVPVLFTWPSKGSVLAYGYDRESSTYSRNQLEDVLSGLVADPSVGEVSILAHSMGNWLLLESLRQMAIRGGRIPHKIKNVLLAAPDVDIDIAREQIADMGPAKPNFTLFVSRADKALALSKNVWGSSARLGDIDPMKEPYRSMLQRDKIAVYDLSLIGSGGINHDTFATSPEIVELIGTRLARGQAITDGGQRFSDTLLHLLERSHLARGRCGRPRRERARRRARPGRARYLRRAVQAVRRRDHGPLGPAADRRRVAAAACERMDYSGARR